MKFGKLFISMALLLTASHLASAQATNDFGTWSSVQATKVWKSSNNTSSPYAMARAEHRSFDCARSTECFFLMAGGGMSFNKYLKADISYEYWGLPAYNHSTAHKGVASITGSIGSGNISLMMREKYELAYSPQSHSTSHTLRSRLRAQYSIQDIRLTPYIMYEYFNSLTGGKWIRSLHYAGAEWKFTKHSSIDLFYMYHLYQTTTGTAGEHVAGIGYNILF